MQLLLGVAAFFFLPHKIKAYKLTAVGAVEVTSLETLGVVVKTIACPRKKKHTTKGSFTMCPAPHR